MIAAIEITSELVPYIILAVAAIFSFGYFIGYKLGRIDGEMETARWYEGRRKEPQMTNEQKYKTAEERVKAFNAWCPRNKRSEIGCGSCKLKHIVTESSDCMAYWLALEAEDEEKPEPFTREQFESRVRELLKNVVKEGYKDQIRQFFCEAGERIPVECDGYHNRAYGWHWLTTILMTLREEAVPLLDKFWMPKKELFKACKALRIRALSKDVDVRPNWGIRRTTAIARTVFAIKTAFHNIWPKAISAFDGGGKVMSKIITADEKLEPCPFCGGKCVEATPCEENPHIVKCIECGYTTPENAYETFADAVAAHNRVALAVRAARESEVK